MTDTSLGIPLPLGGAWLHGPIGHPLAPYVSTIPENWGFGVTFVPGHGALDDDQRRQAIALRAEFDTLIAANPPTTTAPSAIELAVAAHDDVDPIVLAAVVEWVSIEIENLYAAPLDDFAPSAGYELYELPGDDQIITSSLAPVFAQLTHDLDVRYGEHVDSLTFDGERWRTDSGIAAEHVIVTVSVGGTQGRPDRVRPTAAGRRRRRARPPRRRPGDQAVRDVRHGWWPTDVRPFAVRRRSHAASGGRHDGAHRRADPVLVRHRRHRPRDRVDDRARAVPTRRRGHPRHRPQQLAWLPDYAFGRAHDFSGLMDRMIERFDDWYERLHPRLAVALAAAFGDRDIAVEATDEAFVRGTSAGRPCR